jgi:hypothetical protein
MKTDEIFTKCSCHCSVLWAVQYEDEDQVEVSLWSNGIFPISVSWRDRLRQIWKIIRTGRPWSDSVILESKDAWALGVWLVKHTARVKR